ncbi:MAG: primosomal protein N' [Spirochaetes bacterium]|nr:primosomal protein N' [Spirochaetota bacterium]
MSSPVYAEICMGLPVEDAFTYLIPEDMNAVPGVRVIVPFGRKKMIGYVISVHSDTPEFKCREIISLLDDEPVFDDRLVNISKYCAYNYFASLGEVMHLALPSAKSGKNRFIPPFENKFVDDKILNDDQKKVYDSITEGCKKDELLHLIYGITGSGKTEIYIKLAEYFIEKNMSVIYLVPEITLSSQIYKRLYEVFGDSLILYHSRLTPNQKLDNWRKFYSGTAKIAVGTRSSVFLQAPSLGMIIVDEEHDPSYKEGSSPRYNARRVAIYRSRTEKCAVVFGSATPSIETFYAAENGVLKYHEIESRHGAAGLPSVEIIEMEGSSQEFLSNKLKIEIKNTLSKGNQVILLLNRRGYSPVVMCGDCKTRLECPNCSIGMNFHGSGKLICHYCGYKRSVPDKCPSCSGSDIIKIGSGTQRVEEIINDMYKDRRVYRLDQDSMKNKDALFDLVEKMENREIDILLGTQMVSKGFDFKHVEIVGIILADIGMNMPDFRAAERIFSLLMQVTGRAGRGDVPGRVVIQTLNSGNSMFHFLKSQDYKGFYKNEIEIRKILSYPPFSRIIRLLVRGIDETRVIKASEKIGALVERIVKSRNYNLKILGPAPAPFSKVNRNYRHHIILKGNDIAVIRNVISFVRENFKDNRVYLEIDIDPVELL